MKRIKYSVQFQKLTAGCIEVNIVYMLSETAPIKNLNYSHERKAVL